MSNLNNQNRHLFLFHALVLASLTLSATLLEHASRWTTVALLTPLSSEAKFDDQLQTLSLERVVEHLRNQDAVFIDARPSDDYRFAHIPGASSQPASSEIPISKLEELRELKHPIIVYCGGVDCDASHRVAAQLIKSQIHEVYIFRGGMSEWLRSGMPVQKT